MAEIAGKGSASAPLQRPSEKPRGNGKLSVPPATGVEDLPLGFLPCLLSTGVEFPFVCISDLVLSHKVSPAPQLALGWLRVGGWVLSSLEAVPKPLFPSSGMEGSPSSQSGPADQSGIMRPPQTANGHQGKHSSVKCHRGLGDREESGGAEELEGRKKGERREEKQSARLVRQRC